MDASAGIAEQALVALSLDHAYQAFETLLVRMERALGLPERTGATWHSRILFEAAQPVAGLRPAVYPDEVALDWDELLRFRHFLRHAYTVSLDPQRLTGNLQRLVRAVAATEPFIEALLEALASEP